MKIHHRNKLGDGSNYYSGICFDKLKMGDYYWVDYVGNFYRVLLKVGNYVLAIKV